MELWVRSQNKETLAKVDNLNIDKDDYSIYAQAQTYQIVFGTYKSKERALQILDEIQNILKPKMIVNTYKVEQAELCDGTQFIQPKLDDIQVQNATSYVYEMPEE
jgi:hypothetical protein